jgi:polyisoprenoid-binding protein YceI
VTFLPPGIHPDGDEFLVDGDLTIRGITRRVTLAVELGGFGRTPTVVPGPGSRRRPVSTGTISASAGTP